MTPEQEKLLQQHLTPPTLEMPPIPGSSFEVGTQGPNLDDTVKMAGATPQNVPAAPPEKLAPPPAPVAAMPPVPPQPATESVAPHVDPRIVSSHPGLSPDDIGTYLKQQRGQLDKYGPDQEKAVMDQIARDQHGVKGAALHGIAGLSDGIMQGVARAGNGNAVAQLNQKEQNQIDNARGISKDLDEGNMKHIAAGQSLDQMDPNSSIGKAMLGTYGPLLDKLGIPKDKQAQMVPALISTMAPELIKHEDALAKLEAVRAQKEQFAAFRQDNVDQQNWIKLGHDVNALNAGSRKALGIAASNNMRADRLLRTAQNPDATPEDIHNMTADIQGIYKGGVPDEISLKHGAYHTLRNDIAKVGELLSSNPQAVHTPEVVAHLAKITKELKEIDNKVISDNLGINHVIYKPLIEKDPARWQDLTNSIMGTTSDPAGSSGGANEVTRKTKDGKIAVFDGATKQFLRYQ